MAFGTVLGFHDESLFDELRIAAYDPTVLPPTFFDTASRQTTAMDNVHVQLSAPTSVPEPGSIALFGLGFLGVFSQEKRKPLNKIN